MDFIDLMREPVMLVLSWIDVYQVASYYFSFVFHLMLRNDKTNSLAFLSFLKKGIFFNILYMHINILNGLCFPHHVVQNPFLHFALICEKLDLLMKSLWKDSVLFARIKPKQFAGSPGGISQKHRFISFSS